MFIETPRFPDDIARFAKIRPRFKTSVVILESGHVQANINWKKPLHRMTVDLSIRRWAGLYSFKNFVMAMKGRGNKFRFKDWSDFRSKGPTEDVAFDDQVIGTGDGTTLIYQIKKTYTEGALSTTVDIFKPSSGTVLVGINGVQQVTRFSVDNTNGEITFSANINKTITAITQAANARVTTSTAHGLALNDSVHFSGVAGMTQINGLRGLVTQIVSSTQFDVNIDSTAFGAYTSGGAINTIPQKIPSPESVTAGFEFDLPVMFAIDEPELNLISFDAGDVQTIELIEVRDVS